MLLNTLEHSFLFLYKIDQLFADIFSQVGTSSTLILLTGLYIAPITWQNAKRVMGGWTSRLNVKTKRESIVKVPSRLRKKNHQFYRIASCRWYPETETQSKADLSKNWLLCMCIQECPKARPVVVVVVVFVGRLRSKKK